MPSLYTVLVNSVQARTLCATAPTEVPGAISQGRTREQARANVIDALRVVLTPDEQLAGGTLGPDAEPLELTIA